MERMTKKKWRVQASTTMKTYVYCRIAAQKALEHSKQHPTGSFYFNMMAATFAAFTVEGFLNDLGERKVADWSRLERRLAPKEKLLLLRQLLHLEVDKSRRPFQTLHDMLRVRDALAHGRTIETLSDEIVANPNDESASWPEPEWKKLCQPKSVARMVEDADLIVRDLNAQTGSNRDPFASPSGGWSGADPVEP